MFSHVSIVYCSWEKKIKKEVKHYFETVLSITDKYVKTMC